jgi:dienelactone hydrolase
MNQMSVIWRGLLLVVPACAMAANGAAEQKDSHEPKQYVRAEIPTLMEFVDGTPVRTIEDLDRRRQEIRQLFCEHFTGTFPNQVPKIIAVAILEEHRIGDGSIRRRVRITFETPNKASFEMWVWIPKGDGNRPLLLTQPRDYQIYWAEDALKRGYLVCLYPGLDCHHHEAGYPDYENVWRNFQAEYPSATWQSSLAIQGWLASRALDYLLDPKYGYQIAKNQVGIIGFSRYGKQSLYAVAFDERFTAVVARSSGTPTAAAYRFSGRHTFSESVQDFPEPWAKPSLKEFHGRENELPIEGHGLLALIAPRHCMLHTAHNDSSDPTFAVEQTYLQGREVYSFLKKPENLRNIYRTGDHESGPPPDLITEAHRRQNLDWFDLAFRRGSAKQNEFPEVLLHQFDWEDWKRNQSPTDLAPPFSAVRSSDAKDRGNRIRWMLGQPPQKIEGGPRFHLRTEDELAIPSAERDRWACPNTVRIPVSFGGNISGNVYYNPTVVQPVPAVIWLHPYSYASGANEGYGIQDTTVYHRLAQQGYVVLTYDQCGFGERLLEGARFYEKYPTWSRLGRMVHDVSQAVDFLVDGIGETQGAMPKVVPERIYVLGYSLGGTVGLHAAALDKRIVGVASFCGFTPLRTNDNGKPTGGNQLLYRWHGLQPKLGLFAGHETEIPYDYDDVLALIAPRACLIYAPKRDRFAMFDDVMASVERARPAWANMRQSGALKLMCPDDINRFQKDQQLTFVKWLSELSDAKE